MIASAVVGRAGLVAILATGLTGCAEYMDRKNTIAFSAGNAVQTNIVAHVPDPWPPHSRNKDIAFSGERMARAVRCYESGPKAEESEGGGMTINVNASASTSSGGGTSAQAGGAATECP